MFILLQTHGRLQRALAERVSVPASTSEPVDGAPVRRFCRCHRLAVTAVALTADDRFAFSVSKCGSIFKWEMATMARTQLFRPSDVAHRERAAEAAKAGTEGTAHWVKPKARQGSWLALYAAAVSTDGRYLAVGGGDRKVHVFDAQTGAYLQASWLAENTCLSKCLRSCLRPAAASVGGLAGGLAADLRP